MKTLVRDVVRDRSATAVNFRSCGPWRLVEPQRKGRNEDEAEDQISTDDPPSDQVVHRFTGSLRERLDGDADGKKRSQANQCDPH